MGATIRIWWILPTSKDWKGMDCWDLNWSMDLLKKITSHNSDGLINCLLQPGLFYLRIKKSMREEFDLLIKSCDTRTVPAAKTKSIGLQTDARVVMVFASPSGQFYCNMTNPAHLSGPRHLDSFILTPSLRPPIGTMQKLMPTLTRTAT